MTDLGKLEAGPELDMLISEKIFGLQSGPCSGELEETDGGLACLRCHHCQGWNERDGTAHDFSPKPYSTSIHSAWEVVEKVKGPGRPFRMWTELNDEFYEATFNGGLLLGIAKTAALAICYAALKAVGADK